MSPRPLNAQEGHMPPNAISQTQSGTEDTEHQTPTPQHSRPTATARASTTTVGSRQYGTLNSEPDSSTVRRRISALRGNSMASTIGGQRDGPASPGLAPLSPQISRPQRRPSAIRRQSASRRSVPHRGDTFSADDDPSEVETDREQQLREQQAKERGNDNSSNNINTEDFANPLTRMNTVRRRTAQAPSLARVPSEDGEDDDITPTPKSLDDNQDEVADGDMDDEDALDEDAEDGDISDAESFTLKDRQKAINDTHPFGIRIWKPALYKKNRSVEKNAEEDIHSSPSQIVGKWLWLFNCLWTVFFGWWLSAAAALAGIVCVIFFISPSALAYGRVFFGLMRYLFWPFGQFVKLEQDDNYAEEDEGEGRSISEYERWQSGDLEHGRLMFGAAINHVGSIVGRHRNSIDSASERESLLGRHTRSDHSENETNARKRRLFGRGQWNLGRILFFALFYGFVAPLMIIVSGLCWFMVFWIPMGRVLYILIGHLRKRPLALTFHPDLSYARDNTKPSSIILCTYRAAGLKYWKYTVAGTNIFFINSLSIVLLVIFDYFILSEVLGIEAWFTNPGLLFILGLVSIIPLAYFIGQAVASISAQSSMGLGAFINAFFSTLVEVFLYCVALRQGKARLVEGSIVGSIFAGMLLLPGLSMCAGALKRKTQRFNVKSAGATSTMLLFAMIAAFGPTLFYKIYGAHELICKSCTSSQDEDRDCRQCYFRQVAAASDDFFLEAVQPYCWIAAFLLFLSYVIGLLFTLRTHASLIWQTELDEKRAMNAAPTTDVSPADTRGQSHFGSQIIAQPGPQTPHIKDSQMYRKTYDQTLRSTGIDSGLFGTASDAASTHARDEDGVSIQDHGNSDGNLPHVVPPKSDDHRYESNTRPQLVPGLSDEQNQALLRQVAAVASTAATAAARDAVQHPRQTAYMASHTVKDKHRPSTARLDTIFDAARRNNDSVVHRAEGEHGGGGHDAPNWSRTTSAAILLGATLMYAAVAEILVDTVDVILSSVDIDEKFLGLTLFALVPNTTEFLNAISFAMQGNIALSMEIGSAYVLQVAHLQIPALVLFSAIHAANINYSQPADYTFNLIFPQFDMVTVILTVFLLSYVNGEGKSNYFKGSILVMAYLVILMGFYYSGFIGLDVLGVDPGDTLAMAMGSSRGGRQASRNK